MTSITSTLLLSTISVIIIAIAAWWAAKPSVRWKHIVLPIGIWVVGAVVSLVTIFAVTKRWDFPQACSGAVAGSLGYLWARTWK